MIVTNERLKESYETFVHKSGLTLYLYHMPSFQGAHVQFATKLGSVNAAFKTKEEQEFFIPPHGVAHFLEHRMFEDPDGDAFARFANTGASANAFTSFDKTCYLFGCTDKLYESLEILLKFVTTPYFKEEGTEKEKGIIAQEINMYLDNADWRVLFNLLEGIYHKHPVRIDIAGTVESIHRITAETLNKCYNTYYNLNQMCLSVAGNFNKQEVLELCDKILKPSEDIHIIEAEVIEPPEVVQTQVVQELPVSIPLFHLGFKETPIPLKDKVLVETELEIILECIGGESSPLYEKLYKEGLINSEFSYEIFSGNGYLTLIFAGESKEPEKVKDAIVAEIIRIKQEGLPLELFKGTKKALLGDRVRLFETPQRVCSAMMHGHFVEESIFHPLEVLEKITLEKTEELLQHILKEDKLCLSVIKAGG